MRIIFDLRKVGLGNNGGSLTLIKSGNALVDMGHEVFFIDSMRNKHTWTPLKAKHIKMNPNENKKIPDSDFIIATGYNSVDCTVNAPDRCGRKAHWIRAWEHWQMKDDQILKKILKAPTIKLVNSICLQNKLKSYGFDSHIIRPGYDLEELFPKNVRYSKNGVVLGGLYREGVHGKRKRTKWLFETAQFMKNKYGNTRFWLFGSEANPKGGLLDIYMRGPTKEQKNTFYNCIDIWMAPTMSEGLHIPPAEAMLTGCPVVGTKAELSGIQDYVIPNVTGLLSENDMRSFISYVEYLYKNPEKRKKFGEAGRRKILDIGDRKKNMQIMIDLFTGMIS